MDRPTQMKKVAVIGAGSSGLCAIKSCLEQGLEPFCFEQHDQIGGTWYYTEHKREDQGAPSYQNLITNACIYTQSFSDFSMHHDEYPEYVHRERYHQYLLNYAEHFHLFKHITFNTKIQRVEKSADYSETGRWVVNWIQNGAEHSQIFDAVIVCSGCFRKPIYPDIKGLSKWSKQQSHMYDYRKPDNYKDKTVLIIGNQNSAGEVAADVAPLAKKVYLSIGDNGTVIVSRLITGAQSKERILSYHHYKKSEKQTQAIMKNTCLSYVNHEQYGLCENKRFSDIKRKMVVDGLDIHLVTWKIKVMKLVVEFGDTWMKFSDGSRLDDVDAIIFATGYDPDYSFVDCPDIQGTKRMDWNLYQWQWPLNEIDNNSLVVIAPVGQSGGPHSTFVELQTRWASLVFAGKIKLPPKDYMVKDRLKKAEFVKKHFDGKAVSDYHSNTESLAREIGARPSLWKIFLQDPCLAYHMYYGPVLPQFYRLTGPDAKPEMARKIILDVNSHLNKLKYVPTRSNEGFYKLLLVASSVFAATTLVSLAIKYRR